MSDDAHIIKGMDAILNPNNIKPGIDLRELEKKMISGGLIQQKVRDPVDRYNDELKEMAQKIGINFDEFTKAPAKSTKDITLDADLFKKSDNYNSSSVKSNYNSPKYDSPEESENEDEESENEGEESENEDEQSTPFTNLKSPTETNRFSDTQRFKFGGDLQSRTYEQERREHIDSVMGAEQNSNFSFEKEKREDVKCAMLSEITSMMSSLEGEDIDLSRIPRVDMNSSYEEVETVLKILRHKNDHTRYCSFAEEFLLFGAYALEELFDGKRTFLSRYQPDLTGWHNHVNVKLKRMQHDTGQIVSAVMQDYNIGPMARVLLELIPSAVIYSKMRKQQYSQPSLTFNGNSFSDEEMRKANQNLNNLK
ncbi:hypothetical protein PV-S19_0229 [Pacmanvirus S19]|nr:hypothetical protein PV-S19_0229 [Pacmanvirus S19]